MDGIVGPITRGALNGGSGTNTTTSNGPAPSRSVTIAVQGKLGISADGVFGPQTRRAVRAFQARNGLKGQWGVGSPVSRANVQAGDLVFFNANGLGHRTWASPRATAP